MVLLGIHNTQSESILTEIFWHIIDAFISNHQ